MPGRAGAQGRPDFTGVWFSVTGTHHQATSEDKVFRGDDELPKPPGGPLPLKEPYATQFREAEEKMRSIAARGDLPADTESLCFPDGMPKMMRAILPLEIMQSQNTIVVIAEEMTQVRHIYLNEELPPLEEIEPSYNGYSVGRWDGDDLVVTTVGIRGDVSFLNMPNSGHMKITERLRLLSESLLELNVTLEEPNVLSAPYEFTWTYERNPEHKVREYVCDDNKYSLGANGELILNWEDR